MIRESLDTNILLRLLMREELQHQHEAARKLVETDKVRFFVSDTAINEIAHALIVHYKFSREKARYAIEALSRIHSIDLNHDLILAALDLYCSHNSLSFADCYMAASARFMNASPLWTLDKDLAKKAPPAKLLA